MASEMSRQPGHIRMVIADVDGTLVTQEKVLTKRAGRGCAAPARSRIQFAITSGRPPRAGHVDRSAETHSASGRR